MPLVGRFEVSAHAVSRGLGHGFALEPARLVGAAVRCPKEQNGKGRHIVVPEMGDFGSGPRGRVHQTLLDEHAAHAVAHKDDGASQGPRKLTVCPELLDKRLGHALDGLGGVVGKQRRRRRVVAVSEHPADPDILGEKVTEPVDASLEIGPGLERVFMDIVDGNDAAMISPVPSSEKQREGRGLTQPAGPLGWRCDWHHEGIQNQGALLETGWDGGQLIDA